MPWSSLSVVIPALNVGDTLGEQLDAVLAQALAAEHRVQVVVADNGSTDDSVNVVKARQGGAIDVVLVDASDRLGSNHARNAGAAVADGELLLFCDGDDVVADGWLDALAMGLADADLCWGWLEYRTLNPTVDLATLQLEERHGPNEGNVWMAHGPTGCMGIRASVLRDLGGFDESYLWSGTDTELFWRSQTSGYTARFVDGAVVHVRLAGGLLTYAKRRFRYVQDWPRMYREFRRCGMPRSGAVLVVKQWAWLAIHLPDVFRGARSRGQWLLIAARRAGFLVGSIRARVLYL